MTNGKLGTFIRSLRQLVDPQAAGGLNDGQLLERFLAQRDEAALEVLVWRHGATVLNVCQRVLRHEHDAEDAFQATFLTFVRKARSIGKREAVGSWLYKVAYRIALGIRNGTARRATSRAARDEATVADPTLDLAWRELRPVLDEEMNRLPDKYRVPFVLCYLEGKTNEEAAQQLGCPKGTVTTRLAWVRERLRTRLTRRGLTLSAGALGTLLTRNVASATVPAALVEATVQSGLQYAAGGAAIGVVSARAALLADGMIRGMWLSRLKSISALILVLGTMVTGAGALVVPGAFVSDVESRQREPEAALVSAEPVAAAPVRTDLHGDPLPPGAIARLGSSRLKPDIRLSSLVFSPDGKTLATGRDDHSILLYEAETGKELRRITGHQGAVETLAFAPGGKWGGPLLASGSRDAMIFLWDVTTGKEVGQLAGHEDAVVALAVSADGTILASGSEDHTIRLWNVATGKELQRFAGNPGTSQPVALSADGLVLASGSDDQSVCLREVLTGKERGRFDKLGGPAACLAFAPDGKTLAAAGSQAIVLWDTTTGKELRRLDNGTQGVAFVGFSRDGRTLAAVGSGGATIVLWDWEQGKERCRHKGTLGDFKSVTFSPEGRALAAESEGCNSIRLWDVTGARALGRFGGYPLEFHAVAFAPGGRLVASGNGDTTIRLWDPTTGQQLRLLRGHQGTVLAVAFSPDGATLASSGRDATIRLWDPVSGRERRCLLGHEIAVASLAFSPDGKLLVSGSFDQTMRLWDVARGAEISRFEAHDGPVFAVAFSADGTLLASGSYDGTARVWDRATSKELRRFSAPRNREFIGVAFSLDGTTLATRCAANRISFWDLASGCERFHLDRCAVTPFQYSPDGRTLASESDDGNDVELIELATGEVRQRLRGHRNRVLALHFSPDNKFLVSGSKDLTALVWSLTESARHVHLDGKRLEQLWSDLEGRDAPRAFEAIVALTAAESTVAFLRERLQPRAKVAPATIERWLAALDDDRFAVRQQARHELQQLGEQAEPALRRTLAGTPSLEVRRRLEQLLELLEREVTGQPSGQRLRALRSIEVLERIGTPTARQLLARLAGGAREALLTREAEAALRRLER